MCIIHFLIDFFADTPYPIDPFTFVSTTTEDYKNFKQSNATSSIKGDFAVPDIPDRVTSGGPNSLTPAGSVTPTITPSPATKQPSLKPKTAFPDSLLPMLVAKIDSLATGSFNAIVDSVYLDLREHKVKKNAIEAKIREVCEKHKERKVWVVKDAIRVSNSSLLSEM